MARFDERKPICRSGGFVGAVQSARCEWVHRRSGASGFENDGETISPMVRRSLYSLFFLSLFLSLRVIRKWRDDLDDRWLGSTGWVWTIGVVRSSCSDAIFLLFLSLSLLFSKAGNHLKWKWKRKSFSTVLAIFYGQPEMFFNLTKFEVTTKHSLFRKIISEINLKSKQMEPKYWGNRKYYNITNNNRNKNLSTPQKNKNDTLKKTRRLNECRNPEIVENRTVQSVSFITSGIHYQIPRCISWSEEINP